MSPHIPVVLTNVGTVEQLDGTVAYMLIRRYADGALTACLRENPWATWGPEFTLGGVPVGTVA